ncbi:MAG: LysR family transcriptional regulator [Atopostipes suicloacalis]|nr:LysR family transcriptional regulator [Atopostipes suicloacalis]
MEIRQLKYFLAIAEAKNYSRAAESLFVTQPTLTLSMQKLEKEFDLNFFYQSSEGLQLTDAGLFLYENGSEIVEAYDSLIKHLHTNQETIKETIRIGLTVLSAIQFMKQISKFIADNHNVEVRLIQTGSKKLQAMLADREIDFGILSFPLVEPSIDLLPLKNTEVEGYNVSVVMPSSNPLSNKNELSFKELRDQQFISLSEDYMLGKLTTEKSLKYGFNDQIVFIEDDWKVLRHSLENFNAVVLLPSEFKNFDETPNLSWVPLKGKNSYYPLGIARRKDMVVNETYHKFIEAIKQF